jgi:PAS domain S-box-containing protein
MSPGAPARPGRGGDRRGGGPLPGRPPRPRPLLSTSYRKIVEAAPVGVFSSTLEGRFVLVNTAFARMLGYGSSEELLPLDIPRDIYFDQADRDRILSQYTQAEGIVRVEAVLKKKDGSPLPVWFDGRVVRDTEGRTLGFEGFVHDITERRQADEKLRRSEERFRALVENSHEVTGLLDREGRWLYVSASVRRLLGFEPEEVLAWGRFGSRIHPHDLGPMRETFREVAEGRVPAGRLEFRAQHKDGSWHHFEVFGVNRLDDPNVQAIVMNYREITEQKRAEDALRRSEGRFRALVENSYEVVALFDRNGRWIYVSPSVLPLWGYTPGEMLATRRIAERVHPDEIESVRRSFFTLVDSPGAVFRVEFRARQKNGSWRNVEAVAVNRLDDPSVGAVVANLRDITERKQAEEELRRAYEEHRSLAARMEKVREEEASRIARELHDQTGQALTAIKIQLQTLAKRPAARELAGELGEGVDMTEQALEAVRNLTLDLRPSVLDDLGLVAALRSYLDRQSLRAGFAAELSADLPGGRLSRELETACFRVVQEAVTNAARHARARRVRVELRREGDGLLLEIRDDGIGFDVAAARARARGGQSLGILGMEERVSLLGGTFKLDSSASDGTWIRVRLPALEPHGSGARR